MIRSTKRLTDTTWVSTPNGRDTARATYRPLPVVFPHTAQASADVAHTPFFSWRDPCLMMKSRCLTEIIMKSEIALRAGAWGTRWTCWFCSNLSSGLRLYSCLFSQMSPWPLLFWFACPWEFSHWPRLIDAPATAVEVLMRQEESLTGKARRPLALREHLLRSALRFVVVLMRIWKISTTGALVMKPWCIWLKLTVINSTSTQTLNKGNCLTLKVNMRRHQWRLQSRLGCLRFIWMNVNVLQMSFFECKHTDTLSNTHTIS